MIEKFFSPYAVLVNVVSNGIYFLCVYVFFLYLFIIFIFIIFFFFRPTFLPGALRHIVSAAISFRATFSCNPLRLFLLS